MAMTSEEIATKEFLVGLRGYDKDEVRSFLKAVAADFETASAPAPPAEASASSAEAAAPAGMADLGGQIEAILATANQEASKLKAEAEADAARIRSEADAYGHSTKADADAYAQSTRTDADSYAETTKAAAEQDLSEANKRLATAQDEALGLVADAQTRVDKMMETSKHEAEAAAALGVAHLTTQITELTNARNSSRQHLTEVRAKLDKALAASETDPDSTE